ncbi:MAG: hypothetical protein HY556_02895 [Euryarchaeota archaeon]|nr:hypothetical protein [Euryarchaeota archaeon]
MRLSVVVGVLMGAALVGAAMAMPGSGEVAIVGQAMATVHSMVDGTASAATAIARMSFMGERPIEAPAPQVFNDQRPADIGEGTDAQATDGTGANAGRDGTSTSEATENADTAGVSLDGPLEDSPAEKVADPSTDVTRSDSAEETGTTSDGTRHGPTTMEQSDDAPPSATVIDASSATNKEPTTSATQPAATGPSSPASTGTDAVASSTTLAGLTETSSPGSTSHADATDTPTLTGGKETIEPEKTGVEPAPSSSTTASDEPGSAIIGAGHSVSVSLSVANSGPRIGAKRVVDSARDGGATVVFQVSDTNGRRDISAVEATTDDGTRFTVALLPNEEAVALAAGSNDFDFSGRTQSYGTRVPYADAPQTLRITAKDTWNAIDTASIMIKRPSDPVPPNPLPLPFGMSSTPSAPITAPAVEPGTILIALDGTATGLRSATERDNLDVEVEPPATPVVDAVAASESSNEADAPTQALPIALVAGSAMMHAKKKQRRN